MAAVLACGPGAVLSHEDAASLWGLSGTRSPTDVTAPRGRQGRLRREGIRLHRSRTLEDPDRALRNGIPVTTVARRLFDLAEGKDPMSLARLWEEADKLHLLRIDAVAAAYERGRHRGRARARIRPLLQEARHSERTRSPLEDRFLAFCRHFQLPPPATNVLVLEKEVDAAWLDAQLVSETPVCDLASAGPSGARTQEGRIAPLSGRPRTPHREVCPPPPGAAGVLLDAPRR